MKSKTKNRIAGVFVLLAIFAFIGTCKALAEQNPIVIIGILEVVIFTFAAGMIADFDSLNK